MNDNFQTGDRVTVRDGSSWDGKHGTVTDVDEVVGVAWFYVRLDCHPENVFPFTEELVPEIAGQDVEMTIPGMGTIVLKDWIL